MSNDYKSGFKDGFAAGLEEGKKLASYKYPNYFSLSGGGVTGAVGSMHTMNHGVGANGPAGPYDGPEYANKVWVNGTWADLGG